MNKITVGIIISAVVLIIACSKDDNNLYTGDAFASLNLPSKYFNYENISLPSHYTTNGFTSQFPFQHAAVTFDNTPANNPITNAGATLGRVLFYDKKLSANGNIACASCHKSEHGFSDPNKLSDGINSGKTRRHSMSIVNARFYAGGKFFWDERAPSLEEQVLLSFQDAVKMGMTGTQLEQIAKVQTYYPPLFKSAFGDETITSDRISKALAQFVRSMVSTTSKYDVARSAVNSPIVDFPGFTTQENQGKNLFFIPRILTNGLSGSCAGCHVSEAFVGPIPNGTSGTTNSTVNGIDASSTLDLGINETTKNPKDIGKFKAPSLRNIAVRPPYMHDGRFTTLKQVLDQYSVGIKNHTNLIAPLINSNGLVGQFNFTQSERDAIVAFLNTLTDTKMLSDVKYSSPFK